MSAVAVVNATTAKCHQCGVLIRVGRPWQLLDMIARHDGESHPDRQPGPDARQQR